MIQWWDDDCGWELYENRLSSIELRPQRVSGHLNGARMVGSLATRVIICYSWQSNELLLQSKEPRALQLGL